MEKSFEVVALLILRQVSKMLEVCVDTPQGAKIAFESGAQRIELSAALDVGGVTPSETLIQATRRAIDCPLVVLIRCRSGDFLYDSEERRWMLQEVDRAFGCGADGVAIGGLTADFRLDRDLLSGLPERYPAKEVVIHRAFDFVVEPRAALEQLVEWGFARILTSGGPPTAAEGCVALGALMQAASERIEILPAGGIQPENAREILQKTGCRQLHGSLRNTRYPLGERTKLIERLPCPSRVRDVRKILDEYLSAGSNGSSG